MKRLAYLMGTFPALTETFVLGEIQALVEAGRARRPLLAAATAERPRSARRARTWRRSRTMARPWASRELWAANLRVLESCPRPLSRHAGRRRRRERPSIRSTVVKSLGLFPVAVAFAERMARDGVEHVHAHWANYPATAAYVVARLLGIPYSVTAHVYDATLIRSLMREKIRRASFVVTCNAWSARRLAELVPEARARIVLNYHGVTAGPLRAASGGERSPAPGDPFRIVSCGSLYPRKGFPELLEACRRLRDARRARFDCVILGEGPDARRAGALHRPTRPARRACAWSGARPQREVVGQYGEADLFVLACMTDYLGWREIFSDPVLLLEVGLAIPFRPLTDGIPNVLVEAMAMEPSRRVDDRGGNAGADRGRAHRRSSFRSRTRRRWPRPSSGSCAIRRAPGDGRARPRPRPRAL